MGCKYNNYFSKRRGEKSIEKDGWDGIPIANIWEAAKSLLEIPENHIITHYDVNGKTVNGQYILQADDELRLITTEISKEILNKKML